MKIDITPEEISDALVALDMASDLLREADDERAARYSSTRDSLIKKWAETREVLQKAEQEARYAKWEELFDSGEVTVSFERWQAGELNEG